MSEGREDKVTSTASVDIVKIDREEKVTNAPDESFDRFGPTVETNSVDSDGEDSDYEDYGDMVHLSGASGESGDEEEEKESADEGGVKGESAMVDLTCPAGSARSAESAE